MLSQSFMMSRPTDAREVCNETFLKMEEWKEVFWGCGISERELDDVEIHEELPQAERIADYIKQIKNPYCYKSHGVIVKISFAGKCSLEESLSRCISM